MKRWTMVAMVVAFGAVEAGGLAAQRGPRRGTMLPGEAPPPGVERILRLQEELGLSEGQVAELDAIRREAVQRRTDHRSQMAELASQLRAGQIDAAHMRDEVASFREGQAGVGDAERERVDGVLTDAQRQTLEELTAQQRRAYAFGRAGRMMRGRVGPGRGFGGPGMRSPGRGYGAGFGPGNGPGFGPGMMPGPRANMRGPRGFMRGPRRWGNDLPG